MQSASVNGLIVPSNSSSDTIKDTEISKLDFNYHQLAMLHFYFCIFVAHVQLQGFCRFQPTDNAYKNIQSVQGPNLMTPCMVMRWNENMG